MHTSCRQTGLTIWGFNGEFNPEVRRGNGFPLVKEGALKFRIAFIICSPEVRIYSAPAAISGSSSLQIASVSRDRNCLATTHMQLKSLSGISPGFSIKARAINCMVTGRARICRRWTIQVWINTSESNAERLLAVYYTSRFKASTASWIRVTSFAPLRATVPNVKAYHGVSDGGADGIDSADWI